VYIEVEGPEDKLGQFLAWVRIGPPAASVESVEHAAAEPSGYTGFTIR
jgi:acylphosphatase